MDDSVRWYEMYLSALIVPLQMGKLPIRWTPTQPHSVSLNPENTASVVPKSCELDSSHGNTLLLVLEINKTDEIDSVEAACRQSGSWFPVFAAVPPES